MKENSLPLWIGLTVLAVLLGAGCRRDVVDQLPSESEMAPDRLMIFVHGYVAEADAMASFIHRFTRQGVPLAWLGGEETKGGVRFHGHSFDFGAFSHAGSDHNISVESLARSFAEFYRELPETCPICRRRAHRPVEVTLVGHSFGGIVIREFLMEEAEREGLFRRAQGESAEGTRWHVGRIITTGTPYFGSVRTRLTYGFLSVLINGVIRTAVLGFVFPRAGSVYGGVTDAQARALSFGSPYLWQAHQRWLELLERMERAGYEVPRSLVCLSVGKNLAQVRGDGVTRFASANVAPLLARFGAETFVSSLPHQEMVRRPDRPWEAREQELLVRAIVRFQARGTLAGDQGGVLERYRIVALPEGDRLEPAAGSLDAGESGPVEVRQEVYMQRVDPEDPGSVEDFQRKTRRFGRVLKADLGDVWLCFYDGLPSGDVRPPILPIRTTLSLFQDRPIRSREQAELLTRNEVNADGLAIPVVYGLAQPRSHLIAIPDITPTGVYRLFVRLARGVTLTSRDVLVVNESAPPVPVDDESSEGVLLQVAPYRTNLVHVYLNRARILAEHPELKRLDLREVALVRAEVE